MPPLRRVTERLRREESGFTLIELITVLGMLVIVMTALSSAMIAAHKAEEDMNRRFGSQINARIALDQLRREIHCASAVTTSTASMITLTLGSRCPTAGGGTTDQLVRAGDRDAVGALPAGRKCLHDVGRKTVDYLTTNTLFSYAAQSTSTSRFSR